MTFSPLALRCLSSLVLIPIVVGIIGMGGWAYAILAALCIGIALSEWAHITKTINISFGAKIFLVAGGIFYLGGSFLEMIALRQTTNGFLWTLLFMFCIWASDSGAYLFGKTIGGAKMSPTISPNKTWSGYAGALLFPALILSLGVIVFFDKPITFEIETCLAGIAIGIAGQAGDLMISAMKRKAGLKDTGALIPGHGGILDRIDALLLALPVFLAYMKYVSE